MRLFIFKGFFKSFYLYGSVNPWVLLANREVKKYSPDEIISGKTSIGEKVNVLDDLGNEVEGIIVASPRGAIQGSQNLWNVIKSYKSKTIKYGNNEFKLDKKSFQHIFERHHPNFWEGSISAQQSFLPKNWGVKEVEEAILEVMNQNRALLIGKKSNKGMFQIEETLANINITMGFKDGRIGQFYTR